MITQISTDAEPLINTDVLSVLICGLASVIICVEF